MEALGPTGPPPRRGPLAAAVVAAALGVAALPLTLAFPERLEPYLLTLAVPVTGALVGRARGVAWLGPVSLGLAGVLAGAVALRLGVVVVTVVALGPIAVVGLVAPALRAADRGASAAFLASAATAIVAGFATAPLAPGVTALLVAVLLLGGAGSAVARLVRDAGDG